MRDAVHTRIGALEGEAVKLLQRLIRVESPNPPGDERAIADVCAGIAADLGFEVEQVADDPARVNNVIRWRGSEGRPVLLFNSHLDTPAVGDASAWTSPPYAAELRDGAVWGVGARSARAGIAATFLAARALRECGVTPRGDVLIVQTADELNGGEQGWGVLARRGGIAADFGVFTESNPPPKMEVAARGHLLLSVTTRGHARHTKYKAEPVAGGRAVNAVAKMATVISALEEMRFDGWRPHPYIEGPPIVSVNRVEGGHSKIHMADRCTALADCRYLPDQDPDAVLGEIEGELQRLRAADPDLDVSVEELRRWPALEISPDEPIVRAMQAAIGDVIGRELPLGGIGSTSDLRWMVRDLGIPSCKFAFATSVTGVDEHESVEDLMNTVRVYANLMLDLVA